MSAISKLSSTGRVPEEIRRAAPQQKRFDQDNTQNTVAYVMLDLTRPHGSVPARDVRCYVHGLEEWLIRALARFGVRGGRRQGRVGIWVADTPETEAKIAAIVVRVSRWVSWHGVALNVAPDLSHYGGIVPCGIAERGVTSLAALGVPATIPEVDAALRMAWDEVFSPSDRA